MRKVHNPTKTIVFSESMDIRLVFVLILEKQGKIFFAGMMKLACPPTARTEYKEPGP